MPACHAGGRGFESRQHRHFKIGGNMNNLTPFNRHILVDILEEDEQEQEHSFLLPDDYKKQKSPAPDCFTLSHKSIKVALSIRWRIITTELFERPL